MNRRRIKGGLVGLIGFLLSPLSWWNDLVVNVPLAILFGWLIAGFYEPAFEVATVIGYWLTNVLGLVLLRQGARDAWQTTEPRVRRREWLVDVGMSLLYTGIVAALVYGKIIEPLPKYWK